MRGSMLRLCARTWTCIATRRPCATSWKATDWWPSWATVRSSLAAPVIPTSRSRRERSRLQQPGVPAGRVRPAQRPPCERDGCPEGVTVIVGGGYHGKSTLLRALERGVYPHLAGDGRDWVITRGDAAAVRAEDGSRRDRGRHLALHQRPAVRDRYPQLLHRRDAWFC